MPEKANKIALNVASEKSVFNEIAKLRKTGRRIVFTNGCFDLLHAGHVTYLQAAKNKGDILVVGLNSDASVRKLKGPTRPLNKLSDRATVLAALASVDFVIAFKDPTPVKLIQKLLPDILAKGADYTVGQIVGAKEVLENGGKVLRIKLLKGRSTSRLIQRAQEN